MILIINTSGNGIELAINDKVLKIENAKQSITLLNTAMEFLQQNHINMSDLSQIGVIVGPGSFTGIRMGIAYAKGLGIGLKIPVIPVNVFEIYLHKNPDAFVALDSGRGDFFVAAHDMEPCIMDIDTVETEQMKYPRTVGHIPFDLRDAREIIENKVKSGDLQPAIPMYLRPSYAEK